MPTQETKIKSKRSRLLPRSGTIPVVETGKKTDITVTEYSSRFHRVIENLTAEKLMRLKPSKGIRWINIEGTHDLGLMTALAEHFNIHPLAFEDILHVGQRPKFDSYDDFEFCVLKMIRYDETRHNITEEQVSFILRNNLIISFQEGLEGDVFDPLRDRLRRHLGPVRDRSASFLVYSMMDAIGDNYFIILEKIGDKITNLEERILHDQSQALLKEVYGVKEDLLVTRKAIWPLREVMAKLDRGESRFIHSKDKPYIRDLYEHTNVLIESLENFREMSAVLMDMYMSGVNLKMNEIMKVLTLIATIFMPLSFIAGIYGMNFNTESSPLNMPELNWFWGYPMIWGIFILVGVGMVVYFRKRNWI
jgi:magnesium transporter